MNDLLNEIAVFKSEIIALLDQGESISVDELENIFDNGDIIDYVGQKYGFKNINSTPENQNLLRERLKDVYVSVQEASKKCIENNGFVYLLNILFDIVVQEAYEYKWEAEDVE